MTKFLAMARKEAATLLLDPAVHFATAFIVLLDSFAFYLIVARPGARAVFDDMAHFMLITAVALYPLAAMRFFADENAEGTIENLLTAPVGRFPVLMGKYAAALLYVALSLVPGLVYASLLSYGGNLDWRATLAALLSLFLSGALAMALGLFVSALAVSPVAAAAATCLVLAFMTVAADVDPYAGSAAALVNAVSFVPHARRWIAGELDTRGLVYFVSVSCLFLFYAWLSLGARDAAEKSAGRAARRRMLVTYFLVSSGVLLLVAQAAILHIRGFWETGTPILGIGLRRQGWPWLLPLAAAAGLFAWSSLTYRAARRAERRGRPKPARRYATLTETQVLAVPRLYSPGGRASRRLAAVAALAALAVVVNLNWLSRYPFRTFANSPALRRLTWLGARGWDVTRDRRNSLSPSTHRTLEALQGQAHVYSFLSGDGEYQGVPLAEEMRRLLGRYGDYNGLVVSTFVDPASDPDRAAALARELDAPLDRFGDRLVVTYHGRRLEVPASALAAPPDRRAELAGDSRWVFDGEQGLTQALMRLLDPRTPGVFFTGGHRELSLDEGLWPERSASRLAAALVMNNLRVKRLVVPHGRPIPPECDILVVAAPRTPLTGVETDSIRSYLDRGGRLLFIAPPPDPGVAPADADPLNVLLFSMGGGYRDDVVEDGTNNADGVPLLPLAKRRKAGEGGDAGFVFPSTRSLRDNPRAPDNGWMAEKLLESYPTSSARSADGGRIQGPFTLAFRAARATEAGEARIAVVASSRMASDADIDRGANASALMSIAQWLAGREEPREIAPRPWTDHRVSLSGPSLRFVLWVGLVAPPLAWLMAGLTVWWVRKE